MARRGMMKLLVTSTVIMDERELQEYAERNSERVKLLSPEKFIEQLKNGHRVIVQYPDGTTTSYEIVADN